jgi:hypothetical protein
MAKDLTVILEDRPGTLAEMGETLGTAGVNIEGACGFSTEGNAVIHILVEDSKGARTALEGAGIKVREERDVLLLDIEDRPGTLGATARRIAGAGVNIEVIYLATRTRVVIGVDDIDKARAAL